MSEWRKSCLGQLADIVKGDQVNSDTLDQTGKYPVINGGMEPSGYLDRWNRERESITISEGGNSCGYVSLMKQRFWSGGHCYTLRMVQISNSYLYHYLKFIQQDIMKLRVGSGLPNIQRNDIDEIEVCYPSDDQEQVRIADILCTVDEVIEQTEAAIDKYQAIKAGMMQDLFTRGIDTKTGKLRPTIEEAPELYKETVLGWIPKEWEIASLSEVCGMKSGDGITSKSIDEYGRYPVYGGNGLRGYTANYTHEGSYVLIGRQGALCGNVNRVDGKFYTSEHAVVVSVNSDIDVDWFSYILDSMNLNTYSEASAQPGLAVSKILRLKIRVPKLKEQRMIASVIRSLNTKLEAETALYSEYNQIKQGLMADLLTGSVKTV